MEIEWEKIKYVDKMVKKVEVIVLSKEDAEYYFKESKLKDGILV